MAMTTAIRAFAESLTATRRPSYQKCNIVTFKAPAVPATRPVSHLLQGPVVALLGILFAGPAVAAPTQYPLTLENCRESVTFNAPPKRVVAIGQTQTEILYALGLGDRVVGTAVWFSPVAKPYEAANVKVKRLADNDPSFDRI